FLPDWGDDWEGFVRAAARYGIAVIEGERGQSDALYFAVMLTVFEYARHTRAFLARHLHCLPDLSTPLGWAETVLPAGLGVAPGGKGKEWTPRRLLREGHQAYERRGGCSPEAVDLFAYGLHAAAVLAPGRVPSSTTDRLGAIRAAMFADPEQIHGWDAIPVDLLEEVAVALADTYRKWTRKHRDASDEVFRDWAGAGESNLRKLIIGRVSRRVNRPRAEIAAAIEELFWRSFRYTGIAVSATMNWWLAKATRVGELTAREVSLARLMYTHHEAFGGLPLAVLFDRFDVLGPWLEQVLVAPDTLHLEEFYTLLFYYAAMARWRRKIDSADPCPLRWDPAWIEQTATSGGGEAGGSVEDQDELDALADLAARQSHLCCRCPAPRWTGQEVEVEQGDLVSFRVRCSGCGIEHSLKLSVPDLRALAAGLDDAV
ncbi:MAG TPA: hypothetical protein VKE74_15800, partial [Gemmataceae bacterium]|nr:hypothetical protein [Gemmataceae bacterium]